MNQKLKIIVKNHPSDERVKELIAAVKEFIQITYYSWEEVIKVKKYKLKKKWKIALVILAFVAFTLLLYLISLRIDYLETIL